MVKDPIAWTDAMRDRVIALLNQGTPYRQISEALNREFGVRTRHHTIAGMINRLRRGPRSGEIAPAGSMVKTRWTPEQRGELIDLLDVRRMTRAQAAGYLNRGIGDVTLEAQRLRNGEGVVVPFGAPQPHQRACITCRSPFPSAGPGNRMCDDCRALPTGEHLVIHAMGVSA